MPISQKAVKHRTSISRYKGLAQSLFATDGIAKWASKLWAWDFISGNTSWQHTQAIWVDPRGSY